MRVVPIFLALAAILLLPSVSADEGLSWAEVREVTLQGGVKAPSIWPATAACGGIMVLSLAFAILKRR